MFAVSHAELSGSTLPENVVRHTGQYATTLHRQAHDTNDPTPACSERSRSDTEYKTVSRRAYLTYNLCPNPECFGGDER